MAQKMIDYVQNYYPEGEAPRDYYDPNIMIAERAYSIKPHEEILVVLNGTSFRYNDDTIYLLEIKKNEDITADKQIKFAAINNNHLCLLVKNCSDEFSIYVGYRSPLAWLLNMPRIISKLCFSPGYDLTQIKFNNYNMSNQKESDSFTASDETIVIQN
jgi:hypothetical protein